MDKTKEAEKFVNKIQVLVEYWKGLNKSESEKMDGLAFSILSELDGEGLGTFDLKALEWDSEGESIIDSIQINGYLHELYKH